MVFLQLDIRFIYSMVINRPLALCTLKDYIAHFYYTLLTGSITCKLPYFSKQSVYGCANLREPSPIYYYKMRLMHKE